MTARTVLVVANDTNFGLAAGVFSRDISKAFRTAKRLRAGTVWINTYHIFDAALPFGGYKESGWGREMGHQVLENYLETGRAGRLWRASDTPVRMTPTTREGVRATDQWRAMVEAHRAQNQRLRDPAWQPGADFAPPSVESFRAGRERADDARVLAALLGLVPPDGTVVDVGAGAGRFAIPLARSRQAVVAVEPSAAMRSTLTDDAQRAGVSNLQVVDARWEETSDIRGDLVLASHVVYSLLEIEPFLRRMDAASRAWAAVLVFEGPPLSWLFPFWPRVYGEERLPPPHLPQVLEVVAQLGFPRAEVDLIEVEPFELGPPEVARQKLRRRLYVAPDSAADQRLAHAMAELLEERDGVLIPRTESPIRVGLVRWQPQQAR